MNRTFQQTIYLPGTLAADLDYRFKLDRDCTLVHVSAVSSNAAAGGLQLGTSAQANAFLIKSSTGVSQVPVEFKRTSFVGSEYPRLSAGTIFVANLDYDYNGGGSAVASANVTIVLTFAEG
jgi:hypothetical protein